MRGKLKNSTSIALFLLLSILLGCTEKKKESSIQDSVKEQYYCPMDTDVVQDKPGVCPKCKMELVKKEKHVQHEHTHKEKIYYCPMCPGQEQNKPGICKVCKMDLVPKPDSSETSEQIPDTFSVNTTVFSKVKSVKPIRKTLSVQVEADGYISYDSRRFHAVSLRYEGRIEKLYVRYAFQPVKKGQPLLDIYSHDLRSAQHNYLLILKDSSSGSLLKAA